MEPDLKDERLNEKLLRAIRSRKRRIRWQRFVSILACVSIFVTTYALILPASTMDVDEYAVCGMKHHVHTDACYAWNEVPEERTLICTLEEGEQPASEGDAYQESPDAEPLRHVHTDACYLITEAHRERGDLICTIPEHEHDMNCFVRAQEEAEYCCGYDYEHTHTEECYIDGVLVCSYTEHTHTDECRSIMDMTIESAPASDGAVAVISGLLPVGAKAEIEAVELSYEDMVRYFGEKRAASMNAYVAYDICIMVDGEEWQPDETVSVSVRQPDITVEDGEELAVAHVDSETDDISDVEEVAVDESGEVSFETDGFSLYIFYTFTVDFHYGDVTFSIAGYDDILLSELLAALELDFDMAEIEAVYFSDPFLLEVEAVDGDWLLTSLAPFSTDETLTIVFEDGSTFEIWVTDASGDPEPTPEPTPKYEPAPVTGQDGTYPYNTAGTVMVTGTADAPTSGLEATLGYSYANKNVSGATDNNGRILTDKTVTYMTDSYGAFSSYEKDEFSVALSALAQEFYVSAEDRVTSPIDLILVVDLSSSMKEKTNGTEKRNQAAVAAINQLMKAFLAEDEQNRVGLVEFCKTAEVLLPLYHYDETAVGQGVLEAESGSSNYRAEFTSSFYSYLTNQTGVTGYAKKEWKGGQGTYTQRGLYEAYNMFENATTTATVELGEGRTMTVPRQPVYILLTDGEPVFLETNFKNPPASPSGSSSGAVTKNGKYGYWTIRSASYFKEKTTAHYFEGNGRVKDDAETALFYTIGLGVAEGGYAAAVIDPRIAKNFTAVSTTSDVSDGTTQAGEITKQGQLKKLLDDDCGGTYDGRYDYADDCIASSSLDSDAMKQFFNQVNEEVATARRFGYVLNGESNLTMTDTIGDGMEVKYTAATGAGLCLRYNGENYPLTPATDSSGNPYYHYAGGAVLVTHANKKDYVDLGAVKVTITTDTNGHQVVTMTVPDDVIPAFYPDEAKASDINPVFPLRLLYKVGLTEVNRTKAANGELTGQTFYTNAGALDTTTVGADSECMIDSVNPYYNRIEKAGMPVDPATNKKWWPEYASALTELGPTHSSGWNTVAKTGTQIGEKDNASSYTYDGTTYALSNTLGNNGKLTFEPNTMQITVTKSWVGHTPGDSDTVTVSLYQQTGTNKWAPVTDSGGSAVTAELKKSNTTPWTYTFEKLPKLASGYTYAVTEGTVPAGFTVSYSPATPGYIVVGGTKINAAVVTADGDAEITITNTAGSALPSTGGNGTIPYVLIGLALIAGSLTGGALLRRKRERKAN